MFLFEIIFEQLIIVKYIYFRSIPIYHTSSIFSYILLTISIIVSVTPSGSTLKDYFGGGKYYPPGKTAVDVCGEAEDTYSIENLEKMQRYVYYFRLRFNPFF